ncbi:MAG: four helix bundle protein [Lewinellaceae bacterium]|jgi:four helix bundle protein|nr:four helix bundle protein [Lewinellaceae bacterium]
MEEKINNKGALREKSFNLALRLIKMCRYIREERREFDITKQLLKSGTNPGAMVRESEYAETGADFIHKLGIAQKELNESRFWIDLLYAAEYIQEPEYRSIMEDVDEVMRLLTSSIKTRKQNLKK